MKFLKWFLGLFVFLGVGFLLYRYWRRSQELAKQATLIEQTRVENTVQTTKAKVGATVTEIAALNEEARQVDEVLDALEESVKKQQIEHSADIKEIKEIKTWNQFDEFVKSRPH